MGVEIERKFLVDADRLPPPESSAAIEQGYLDGARVTVRVRISGNDAYLTLKGGGEGIERMEFEYPVPLKDAQQMLDAFCLPGRVKKVRHRYTVGGRLWEVDVFEGENRGLVLAEVELTSQSEEIEIPEWVTREVSGDVRYFNAYLVHHPYNSWPDESQENPSGR